MVAQAGTVSIPRSALDELIHLRDEFDTVIESLDLEVDEEAMQQLATSRREYERGLARPIEELNLDDL